MFVDFTVGQNNFRNKIPFPNLSSNLSWLEIVIHQQPWHNQAKLSKSRICRNCNWISPSLKLFFFIQLRQIDRQWIKQRRTAILWGKSHHNSWLLDLLTPTYQNTWLWHISKNNSLIRFFFPQLNSASVCDPKMIIGHGKRHRWHESVSY